MSLLISAETVPLSTDAEGVVYVEGTRVTLDTLVFAFKEGGTAEEIAQDYPSLDLADVYAVIGYYLQHQSEVDEYLRERGERRDAVRRQNEARFDPRGLRERLLARRRDAAS
jgi:uncharacterized protein (DUF433 family)